MGGLLLQGCSNDPEDEEEKLELSTSELNFTNADETKTVKLTSNVRWMAMSNETWCTIDPTKGSGDAELEINCLENTDALDRPAKITIKTEGGTVIREITISQLGTSPSIVVSPKTKTADKNGETFDVEVTANVDYEMIFSEPWIKEAVVSRADGKTIILEVLPNPDVDERKGEVIFSQKNGTEADILQITQPGQGIRIQVDSKTKRLGAAKADFSIEVYADVEFETIIQGGWIKEKVVSRTTASGGFSSIKTFEAEKNTDPSERTARIIFKQVNELMADTVTVTQSEEVNLSGKNLAKSLIAVSALGAPMEYPNREEMYFNYDSQSRLTHVDVLIDYDDGDGIYAHKFQAYITYNADNDVEKIEEYDSNMLISRSKELVSKVGNVLKYKIVDYNGGLATERETIELKLNAQGRVTEIGVDTDKYIYSYNAAGDMTKREMSGDSDYIAYQYDTKNGMFSAVAAPIYGLWLMPEIDKPLWFIKNNVTRLDIKYGITYTTLVSYVYNSNDFPIKATADAPDGELLYEATYY